MGSDHRARAGRRHHLNAPVAGVYGVGCRVRRGQALSQSVSATVSLQVEQGQEGQQGQQEQDSQEDTPNPTALAARFGEVPGSHDGSASFTFELRFNETPKGDFSYATLRDHTFTVTGGAVTNDRRLDKPSSILWRITVVPDSDADVILILPATENCDDDGAICTEDERMLSNRLELTVSGPSQ